MREDIDQTEMNGLYDRLGRAFARASCFPVVERDFMKRQRFVDAAEDAAWVYRNAPTYDPVFSDLDGRGFWLNVRRHGMRSADGERDMIAHVAVRVWRDTTLKELFVESGFIQDRASGHQVTFDCTETDHVRGNLSYIGGAWVHPEYRHRRVAGLLMAFCQLHLLEHFDADFGIGLIDDKAAQAGMGARTWRFRHHHSGGTWEWPGHGRFPFWVIYNTRSEMLDEARRIIEAAESLDEPEARRASA
jgi:hypothetical protein